MSVCVCVYTTDKRERMKGGGKELLGMYLHCIVLVYRCFFLTNVYSETYSFNLDQVCL